MKLLSEFTTPKINTNDDEVYKYMSRLIANELSYITKPCYFSKFVKYDLDIQRKLNISNIEINTFINSIDFTNIIAFRKGFSDKKTIVSLLGVLNYINKNEEISKLFFQYLTIKFYSSRIHIHFPKFCNDKIWDRSFEILSPNHLYKKSGGIANFIMYIANFDFEKAKSKFKNPKLTDRDLYLIVLGLRTKISQSVKSFAQSYYKVAKEVEGSDKSKSDPLENDAQVSGTQLIADKISMLMCTYQQIDEGALNYSISIAKINKDIATNILVELSKVENRDKIKFIIILIGKLNDLKSVCIEQSRNNLIRKIISTKILKKYDIREEVIKILSGLDNSYKWANIDKNQLSIFFINYLLIYMRNRIC